MNLSHAHKPTILITMDWFDPAFKAGGPVQSVVNMVKELNTAAKFFIICGNQDLDGSLLTGIVTNQWVQYDADVWVWYTDSRPTFFFYKKIARTIHPDTLFVIGLFSIFYNWLPLMSILCNRKIWSVRGMLHPGALRMKSIKKNWFLQIMRFLGVDRKVFFHATDDVEAGYISSNISPKAKIFVAANFPKKWQALTPIEKQAGTLKLLSVALISPMKNHLLVLETLKKCKGNLEYHIIGAIKDANYWSLCLECINQLPENIRVVYHGEVEPNRVQAYLQQAHVSILPSESENYGHALIESLLVGRPIITSHNTPWNALQLHQAGLNVDLSIESVHQAIQYFIDLDHANYKDISLAAAQYATEKIESMDLKSSYQIMFNLPA